MVNNNHKDDRIENRKYPYKLPFEVQIFYRYIAGQVSNKSCPSQYYPKIFHLGLFNHRPEGKFHRGVDQVMGRNIDRNKKQYYKNI